ncbi:hypothetical protein CPB84DRAFT_1857559 [Gymnopilus junonius]|uniref:Uncharacterized protein n=1 Tax=Gymnopilus junonius TaxID=109634 RepID=A0A9P5N8U5_GYMJU|nr:hypothetical protein CPB84DRAFT_1857559 [Gymnopilus junonius]
MKDAKMKTLELDTKDSFETKLIDALLFALTGKGTVRPRQRTPVNVWRKTKRSEIEAKSKFIAEKDGLANDQLAALRDKVARDMFDALPDAEKEHWKQQAEVESSAVLDQWKRNGTMQVERTRGNPNVNKDHQHAIQGLVRVSKIFLDCVEKTTGWKATLIAGGPEPARDGQLNMISVHAGTTLGESKMDLVGALGARYENVISGFGDFLEMCYTSEDCRLSALKPGKNVSPLGLDDVIKEGAYVHPLGFPESNSFEIMSVSTTNSLTRVHMPTLFGSEIASASLLPDFIEIPYFHAVSTCTSIIGRIFHQYSSPVVMDSKEIRRLHSDELTARKSFSSTPEPSYLHSRHSPISPCRSSSQKYSIFSTPPSRGLSPVSSSRQLQLPRIYFPTILNSPELPHFFPTDNRYNDEGNNTLQGRKRGESGARSSMGERDRSSSRPPKRSKPRRTDVSFLIDPEPPNE